MIETPTARITRRETIDKLNTIEFELLIIGGGATGSGIALDAASRGIKTALIEKRDFASGTSSKSTKLIHGGLRYLKQLDVQLVRETGTERAILHRLAPHLVLPEKMLMPLIEGGNYGYWSTSFGLKVYDLLANVKGDDRRKMLNKNEALAHEPLLGSKNLKGAGYYAEYRTDDARLTIELIKTAAQYDATVTNYCEAVDFLYDDKDQIIGVNCVDSLTQKPLTIKAKTIVSATGPWVDGLRKKDGPLTGGKLHLTKGIHLVVPYEKFPLKQTVYFDVPDGRMVFAIPRGRTTYFGTTDTTYQGDLDRIVCTQDDLNYLLEAINSTFPDVNLAPEDIESNWAGLRPLIHQEGKSPSELSRKDEIFQSKTGLISIAGGKLTGYRKMAERVVDIVAKRLDGNTIESIQDCTTATIPLTNNKLSDSAETEQYFAQLKTQVVALGLPEYYGWYLGTTYGTQADSILRGMDQYADLPPNIAIACSEAYYGVHHELVNTAADLFVRRTGKIFFDMVSIDAIRSDVMSVLQSELDWDEERLSHENQSLDNWIKDCSTYYPN